MVVVVVVEEEVEPGVSGVAGRRKELNANITNPGSGGEAGGAGGAAGAGGGGGGEGGIGGDGGRQSEQVLKQFSSTQPSLQWAPELPIQ